MIGFILFYFKLTCGLQNEKVDILHFCETNTEAKYSGHEGCYTDYPAVYVKTIVPVYSYTSTRSIPCELCTGRATGTKSNPWNLEQFGRREQYPTHGT